MRKRRVDGRTCLIEESAWIGIRDKNEEGDEIK